MAQNAQVAQSKKPLIILLCVLIATIVVLSIVLFNLIFSSYKIDEKRFPDPVLRQTISVNVDFDGDGIISREEADAVTAFDFENVSSIEGLDIFPNLQELSCSGDNLTSLNIKGCRQLKTVSAPGCQSLTSLTLGSNGELESLDIPDSPVSEIDVRGASKLQSIACKDSVVIQNLEDTPLHQYWVIESLKMTGSSEFDMDVTANYDVNGNLQRLATENAKYGDAIYTYEYDGQGKCVAARVSSKSGSSAVTPVMDYTLAYNDKGLLIDETEKIVNSGSDSTSTTIAYNDLGLPISLKRENMQKTLTYDSNGALTALTTTPTANNYLTIANNGAGNISSVVDRPSSDRLSPSEYTMTYDAAGRLQKLVFSSESLSYTQQMEYDANGRLVNTTRDVTANPAYPTRFLPSSVTSTKFTYNEQGLLTNITPAKTGPGTAQSCAIGYKRLLLARETAPKANFVDLSDPLSPEIYGAYWELLPFLNSSSLSWMGSMKNVMSHIS